MLSKSLHDAGLAEISDYLQQKYYEPMSVAFGQSKPGEPVETLKVMIREYLSLRLDRLLPYLAELSRKSAEGHNCGTCQGRCHLEHATYVTELMYSHSLIRSGVVVGSPESESAHLNALLAESITVETTYLIPAIVKAQKTINVHG